MNKIIQLENQINLTNGSCGLSSNSCTAGSTTGYLAGACGGSQTWSCLGTNGGTTASCSIPNPACVVAVSGSCGPLSNTCITGLSSGYNAGSCGGSQTWSCLGSGGGSNASCNKANPACFVAGTCGTANGKTYPYTTTTYGTDTQCGAGNGVSTNTAFPAQGATLTWTCGGSGTGASSATCSAIRNAGPINGVCGSLPGLVPVSPVFASFGPGCNPVEGTYTCDVAHIGKLLRCSTVYNPAVTTVSVLNDIYSYCGQQSGYNMSNMCAAGDLLQLSGNFWMLPGAHRDELTGPFTWICQGKNGGTNSPVCNTSTVPAAQCGSVYMTCNVGAANTQNDPNWCNGYWSWTCNNFEKTVSCRASSGCRYYGAPIYGGSAMRCDAPPGNWSSPNICGTSLAGQPCQSDRVYYVSTGPGTSNWYRQTCQ